MKRLLHTMLRVGDMDRAVNFYTRVLDMHVLRTLDNPHERYTLKFLGYGNENESCVLELTYNYGVDSYDMGNAYGHIAIGVNNCAVACDAVRSRGGKVIYDVTQLTGSNEIIAFIVDPDGYQIELIQRQ